MSTNTPAAEKDSGNRLFDDLLTDHVFLGLDAEGYLHHLDRQTATVHRLTLDGRRERRTDLSVRECPPARALELYLRFVGTQIGWDDRRKVTAADLWDRADG